MGVWGANYYAPSGSAMFTTLDRDLFLPPDPANLLAAWRVCQDNGFELFARTEPLDEPRDAELARAVVERRALTRASDGMGTDVDLSLVMSGFEFETIWPVRRTFFRGRGLAAVRPRRIGGLGPPRGPTACARDRIATAAATSSPDCLRRPARGGWPFREKFRAGR